MDYRIIARLPGGGFSEIFEVEDAAGALPERLILKRLNAEMSALPAVRVAFAEEALLLRELRHPNIVTFRRCHFDPQQRVCLLMEKVHGEPFDAWARRHAAAPGQVLDLFDQILGAVDYLHHRAVPFLHLDLKPDNVLVTVGSEGPRPVLIDFGIARRSGAPGLKAYTPPYGAPEQATGASLGCATDVHALGQMLEETVGLLARPELPLLAVAARAKSAKPRQRYANAGEMRLAYRRARRSNSAVTDLPDKQVKETPRRRSRGVIAAGLSILAITAGAIGLTVRSGGGGAGPPGTVSAGADQPPNTEEMRRHFRSLQSQFEETVINRRCSLADPLYLSARDLSDTLSEQSEVGQWMKHGVEEMRRNCQLIESNGPESDAIIANLRQKHLSYPQP